MNIIDAKITDLRHALDSQKITSLELVKAYIDRIMRFDRSGPCLNSIPLLNPSALDEAKASDARRARGDLLGPLDGIPYTAKNSFKVEGMTVAAGSPAFADLIATDDAFAIEKFRASGAILLGLTNMPPMANGGMQRGLYGRAESPYNPNFLTAAFASGSSNGSGTATAASFAAFGLGEETWSSGRAPASNNALCAYTPSRGIISVRGNWPLVPTMDVVVPHTRCMSDMLEILDVLVHDDEQSRGDFWRQQPWVKLPKASQVRPNSYKTLARGSLAGKRLGVPAMYINADEQAGSANSVGIGGPTGQKIKTRNSIMSLWEQAKYALRVAGAEVVVVDFPVVSNYEGDRDNVPNIQNRGILPDEFLYQEITDLSVWAWDDFLNSNSDPKLNRLSDVDGEKIFPAPEGALPDRYTGFADDIAEYPAIARSKPNLGLYDIPTLPKGLMGLEEIRRIDLEDWMDEKQLDAVIFPAVADVAPADADLNETSADIAWRNGVWVANGNLAIRHLGIPTVTVPMGTMDDIGMPVGLTFAGRAYSDNSLIELACAFEATGRYRSLPPSTS